MKLARTNLLLAAALSVCAAASGAANLEKQVNEADLVVFGRVFKIDEGEPDLELKKMGIDFRTDIASLAAVEVLKGGPALRGKRVKIGFPAFPKPGELKIELNQNGVWLLIQSDQKHYIVKSTDYFLPANKLGAARRAVRSAMGLGKRPAKPADRAERAAKLCKDLAAEKPDATRRLAAHQLGELGEPQAVPALIDALNDQNPPVRLAADIALRKITGHRAQVDFQHGSVEVRSRAAAAWREWWAANRDKKRQEILLAAAKTGERPQPEFQYAIEGLAAYDDLALLPLFRRTLDSAMSSKDSALAAAAARYLGRVKHRASVPRLASILHESWPSASARSAAATAIGNTVGKDFGAGTKAIDKCIEWWRANKDKFQ